MSRWPPSNIMAAPTNDGDLVVGWEKDTFFVDSETPESVVVLLNQAPYTERRGAERDEVTIPGETVSAISGSVVVEIGFQWGSEPPLFSGIVLQRGAPVRFVNLAAHAPKVLARTPTTLHEPNKMTIEWSVLSATDVAVVWGPMDDPARYRKHITPRGTPTGARYTGKFVTDQPLVPRTTYVFSVQAHNTFHNTAAEAAIAVNSVDNFRSLRAFLRASGVAPPVRVRGVLDGRQRLKAVMGW